MRERMNLATVTDLAIALLTIGSFFLPFEYASSLQMALLFAFSGAITNHLAIHMLFYRVPLLYGSGIIELKFDAIKLELKSLMMREFFSETALLQFAKLQEKHLDLADIVQSSDLSVAFDALKQTVMESSFGNVLSMFGGEKAIENLRESFTEKLRTALIFFVNDAQFKQSINAHLEDSTKQSISLIEQIIDERMQEIAMQDVRSMLYTLMHKYLQWLVVWGALFGLIIGLISAALIR